MTTEIQKLEADYAAQAARIEQLTAENLALKQILTLVCDHDYEPEYQSVVPEWISVSDRLPENETLVLTIDKNSFINTAVFVHGDGYSFLCSFNLRQIPSVTHWMPLPAAPAPQEG